MREDGISDEPEPVDVSGRVTEAARRLAAIPGLRKRFGVIRLWPELQVAEHECIERLRRAAELIGAEIVVLDRYGRPGADPALAASPPNLDFVLSLHFDSPKCSSAISIGALWNPIQFYVEWGFERTWSNQMSHDLLASTGSEFIRKFVEAERGSTVAAEMPQLNHGLADPIFSPIPRERYDAFYCGINWERLGKRKGRHHDFLVALDRRGRLEAYGPSKLQGVSVWSGFAGYRGMLPFDGRTVIRKAWEAGAALVISSDAHKASGVMSSRFFEAAAAGAVMLGDDHPSFVRQSAITTFRFQ